MFVQVAVGLWVLWVQVVGRVVGAGCECVCGCCGCGTPPGVPAQAVRQHAQEDEDGVGSQW